MSHTLKKIFLLAFSGSQPRLVLHLKLIRYLSGNGYHKIAMLVANRIQRKFSVFISHKASLPGTVKFPHPTGIVIGEGVAVGERVTIYQNVTIGGARIGDAQKNDYPKIGDGTVIFAGAVIAGRVKIGRNCVVGANSVVLNDVPDNATVVGAPARVIRVIASANEVKNLEVGNERHQ
ncbi:MAG TPA: serine acetyltransferase [Candidatus Accumulibacter phosphatis]|nr:serine acetyltransferase [Candidatus Accumulibacter phosphatis]